MVRGSLTQGSFSVIDKSKQLTILVVKIFITIGAIYWIFHGLDFDALSLSWSNVQGQWVLIALLLQFLALGIGMSRWWILCEYSTNQKIPFSKITNAYFLGLLFNQFLPSSVGGDAVRTFAVYRYGFSGKELISAGIMDRLIGVLSLISIALISAYFHASLPIAEEFEWIIAAIGLIFISGLLLVMNHRCRALIRKVVDLAGSAKILTVLRDILNISASYGKSPRIIVACYVLSILLQISVILAYMSVGVGLSVDQSFLDYAVVISTVYVVSSLPISLGGLGIREGTFVALFIMIGVDKEIATNLSLLYLIVLWTSCLPGVFVFLRHRELLTAGKNELTAVS